MPSRKPAPSVHGDSVLSRHLRFEFADEENRALLGSYAISTSLGIAFLLLQQFGPRSDRILSLLPDRVPGIVVVDLGSGANPSAKAGRAPDGGALRPNRTGASESSVPGQIGRAFQAHDGSLTGGLPNDPSGLLRDVAVSSARAGGDEGATGKTVLGSDASGQEATVPTRGGIGAGSGNGSGIGAMGSRGGAVSRSAIAVSGPAAVPVDPVPNLGRNVADVGTFVRGREAELRFCYEENGLRVNPDLGGSITVAITIGANGAIAGAQVTRRSWSGAGAATSESCILRTIRGWRLPASDKGAGTYTFPLNFTK